MHASRSTMLTCISMHNFIKLFHSTSVYVYFRRRENIDKKYYNCVLIESNGMEASWAHRTGENEKKDNVTAKLICVFVFAYMQKAGFLMTRLISFQFFTAENKIICI